MPLAPYFPYFQLCELLFDDKSWYGGADMVFVCIEVRCCGDDGGDDGGRLHCMHPHMRMHLEQDSVCGSSTL